MKNAISGDLVLRKQRLGGRRELGQVLGVKAGHVCYTK